MSKNSADIGLVGLAVMGQNLALNIADHGYTIAVFNRDPEKTRKFIAQAQKEEPSHERLIPFEDLASFVLSIKRPRKIVLLVKAGSATDVTINALVPFLEQGDIIIDGGNSLWTDTIRREKELRAKGLEFIGSGVSGGETGARFGPSLMPSGTRMAWASLEPIWRDIAAKVDSKTGQPLEGAKPGKPDLLSRVLDALGALVAVVVLGSHDANVPVKPTSDSSRSARSFLELCIYGHGC